MAEMPQLLQAVLDDPDSDSPRLAYADWCERQEDSATQARGEFIRAQIELLSVQGEIRRTVPLDHTISTLSDRYGRVWTEAIAGVVNDTEFDRGFVELVSLPAASFLRFAPEIFRIAPVRHLNLQDVRSVAEKLFRSPYLRNIRSLDIRRCDLGDTAMSHLAASTHLANLRWLNLAENRISEYGANALAISQNLPHLAFADFGSNEVELNETYAHDGGLIVESLQPDASIRLEATHGYKAWLHHQPATIAETTPDRFRIAPAISAEMPHPVA